MLFSELFTSVFSALYNVFTTISLYTTSLTFFKSFGTVFNLPTTNLFTSVLNNFKKLKL